MATQSKTPQSLLCARMGRTSCQWQAPLGGDGDRARARVFLCGCGSRTMLQLVLSVLIALPLGKGHSS